MIKKLLIAIILFCLGTVLFFYQESWLIINIPTTYNLTNNVKIQSKTSKNILIYLWHKDRFKTESCDILVTLNQAQTIQQIVHHFFTNYEDMMNSDTQTIVQSVILSPSEKQAFISLNHSSFNPQSSTFEKLMLIKSLLKTLHEAKLTITHIYLLVQHRPLIDHHLNFEIAWPLANDA